MLAIVHWIWTRRKGHGRRPAHDRRGAGYREHIEEEGLPLSGIGERASDGDGYDAKPVHHQYAEIRVSPSIAFALTVLAATLFALNKRYVRAPEFSRLLQSDEGSAH